MHRNRVLPYSFALAALAVVFMAAPVWSQEVSASITGVISDASGAVVLGAKVTAKDQARGTTYEMTTNEAGVFLFPRIPPGSYEVRIEAKGFKTAVRSDLVLEVNQRARLDTSLEVGAITESVNVTGEPPLLQTDTTIVGSTLSTNKLTNTPLISRNYITLTLLAPAATLLRSGLPSAPTTGPAA